MTTKQHCISPCLLSIVSTCICESKNREHEKDWEREWKRGKRWKGEVWGRFVVMATDQYTTDDIYYIQLLNTYFIDFLFTLQYTDCKTELINILREKKFNDKYTCRCYKWLTTPHAVFVLFYFLLHQYLNGI